MKQRVTWLVVILILAGGTVFAQVKPHVNVLTELRTENAQLRDRVDMLEKALTDIRATLSAKTSETPASTVVPAAVPAEKQAVAKDAKKDEKPSIKGKYPVELYGYVKLDMSTDDSRTQLGNDARWVPSEATYANHREYNMTANPSRFGLRFKGPEEGKARVSGNLEFDLYGSSSLGSNGGAFESSAAPRVRHAFVQVDWPEDDWSLLAGQTWDLIGPLNPSMLDYTVAWWAGNIGYRHPQLRFTKGFEAGKDSKVTVQVAATRTNGDKNVLEQTDTGAAAGSPSVQGRISYSFPTYKDKKGVKGVIGLWGHSGKEEYAYAANGDSVTLDSNSAGMDLSLPLSKVFKLQGELWRGKNLDDYMGGIAQGINVMSASATGGVVNATTFTGKFIGAKSISSRGGWFELGFGPFDRWQFNLGASVDNPDDDQLPNLARTSNQAKWLNVIYDLNSAVQIGLEYVQLHTDYKNAHDGDDGRLQSSFIYKF
ncbi:MAG: hypothetical protein HQM09_02665 [Candidatus Riflebacteria bacterium]|nr:hypothetical protein [Candidatus Riflebacteria bacterium]